MDPAQNYDHGNMKTLDFLFSSFLAANHGSNSTQKVLFGKRENLPCCFMHSHAIRDPPKMYSLLISWKNFGFKKKGKKGKKKERGWNWIDLDSNVGWIDERGVCEWRWNFLWIEARV